MDKATYEALWRSTRKKMKCYIVIVPPTVELGSYKFIAKKMACQTLRQDALQYYNLIRDREGALPLKRLPNGTKFILRD